jgi:probable DNA metabolism protein
MDYLYDGSFEGFMTCVYEHYYSQQAAGIYKKESYQMNMINPFTSVETSEEKFKKVYNGIQEKISPFSLGTVYQAFLAEEKNYEMDILNYLILGFKIGRQIDDVYVHDMVTPVRDAVKKLQNEKQLYLGILRFSDKQGYLYAVFEPECNILSLLGNHFTDRMPEEKIIIFDRRRRQALFGQEKEWKIVDEFEPPIYLQNSKDQEKWEEMWKTYFVHIGIKERKNRRCQMKFVPLKVRKHLTEFK